MAACAALRVAAAAAAAAAAAYPPLTDVFVGGADGYACYRIPALVRLPASGALLAFAEGRRYSCNDHGWVDLVVKRSTDGGASWGALTVIHSESSPSANVTIGNPAPVALSDGDGVLLPFCRNNAAVGTLASADGGSSWSGPAYVGGLPADWAWVATGPPGSLQLPGATGRLLVPIDYYVHSQGDYNSSALLSDDGGKSWRVSSTGVPGGNEAQAAALPWVGPGAVLLSMRSADGPRRLAALSTDGGDSWGAPWPTITESQCEASTLALPTGGVNGGPALVMSSAFDPAGRTNMTLHASGDDGRSWAPVLRVYPGSAAYSSLADLGAGGGGGSNVGLLFERDGYARISFAALALPPL